MLNIAITALKTIVQGNVEFNDQSYLGSHLPGHHHHQHGFNHKHHHHHFDFDVDVNVQVVD